jgi:hypothetical protein
MKRKALFVFTMFFSIFLIVGANSASAQQQFLYAADGAGTNIADLMILDPLTGEVEEVIGSIGYTCTGLAFSPDGSLYGVTGNQDPLCNWCLISIDPLTGAGTEVGGIEGLMDDISFSPQGALFGWYKGGDRLAWINQTTTFSILVGPSDLTTFGNGLAFAPNGTLYLAGDGDTGNLYTISPVSGDVVTATHLNGTNGWGIGGLAVDNTGLIYGVRKKNVPESGPPAQADLITINPANGVITSVGVIRDASGPIPNMDSIAFSPIVCDVRTGFWVPAGELNLGSGVFIEIQRNTLAFGWGAMDDQGLPTYLFSETRRVGSSETFNGDLMEFTMGPTFAGPPTPSVSILPAGAVTVTFTNNTSANITGAVNGEAFNKTINKTFGQ